MRGDPLKLIVLAVLVVLAHLIPLVVPGLPELDREPSRRFLIAVWAVDGALLGALIVAAFFIGQTAQNGRLSVVTFLAALSELRIVEAVALVLGSLMGIGVQILAFEPAPSPWMVAPGSLGALPLVTAAMFLLTVGLLGWIIHQVLEFAHPDRAARLASMKASELEACAVRFRRLEGRRRRRETAALFEGLSIGQRRGTPSSSHRSRLLLRVSRMFESVRWRFAGSQESSASLGRLVDDAMEDAIEALSSHDVRQVRHAISVFTSAWLVLCAHTRAEPDASLAVPDDEDLDWEFFRLETSVRTLLQRLSGQTSAPVVQEVAWIPFVFWIHANTEGSHEGMRRALRLAEFCYRELVRLQRPEAIELWELNWEQDFRGPEKTLIALHRELRSEGATAQGALQALQVAQVVATEALISSVRLLLANEQDAAIKRFWSARAAHKTLWWVGHGNPEMSQADLEDERVNNLARERDAWFASSLLDYMGVAAICSHPWDRGKRALAAAIGAFEVDCDFPGALLESEESPVTLRWSMIDSVDVMESLPSPKDGDSWPSPSVYDLPSFGFVAYLSEMSADSYSRLQEAAAVSPGMRPPFWETSGVLELVGNQLGDWLLVNELGIGRARKLLPDPSFGRSSDDS